MTTDPETPIVEGVPDFWQRVADARDRCLVLDYDGTLAPFTKDRMRAVPLEGVVELLLEIRDAGRTYLAIMTGRPLYELIALLGDLDIPVSGSQGSEFRFPDGTTQTHMPSDIQEQRLRTALSEALEIAPEHQAERKVASVAVHTRAMAPDEARRLEDALCAAWSVGADEHDLECRRFSGGVELRLKDIHKGTALSILLDGRNSDSLCVYIGDDNTDEDAFEALRRKGNRNGVGIKVGTRDIETRALGRLADVEAVRDFLRQWVAVTTGR